MELAKKLLREQQLNVNEIANHLCLQHFKPFYRKDLNVPIKFTPKQFSKS